MVYSDKHSHIITVGDTVNVDKTDDNEEFSGTVVGFKGEFVQVEDQEDNVFDCNPTELEVD